MTSSAQILDGGEAQVAPEFLGSTFRFHVIDGLNAADFVVFGIDLVFHASIIFVVLYFLNNLIQGLRPDSHWSSDMVKFKLVKKLDEKTKNALMRMQRACLPEDDPLDPEKEGWWWIGYDGEWPIAFCSLKPSQRYKNAVYMSRSGVNYYYRGYGLQKKMLRMRERFAKRLGFEWSFSDTTDNPASANSLISCGYRLYEPKIHYGYDTTLYWRKPLVSGRGPQYTRK